MKHLVQKSLALLIGAQALLVAAEVNVYSHRHYDTDKALYKAFEKETGIKVNVVKAKAGELIKRLKMEGELSPADIFIAVDAGNLHRAKSEGLFKSVSSKTLEANIPAHLRDSEGQWYGLTKRARIVAYDKSRVKASDLSTYAALADAKWKDRILIRSSNNMYNQSLLASIIEHEGEAKATAWAKGIVANMARTPKGNDRDQMRSVVAGEGDLAIVNTYYLGKLATSRDPKDVKVAESLTLFFPNQDTTGTHINISGAGITKSSKNTEEAIKLLEFLTSPKAQQQYSEANFEYPVNPSVEPGSLIASWGTFKEDKLSLVKLGENNKKAVKIFNTVNWR